MLLIRLLVALLVLLLWYLCYKRFKKRREVFSNRWNFKSNDLKKQRWVINNKFFNWLREDSLFFLKVESFFKNRWERLFDKKKKLVQSDHQESFKEELSGQRTETVLISKKVPKYLILKLVANSIQTFYEGYELYQAILSSELKLSSGGAFAKINDAGNELFKLVPATSSGVFKNNAWGKFRCRGLILYMSYPKNEQDLLVLKEMWRTAQFLIDALGGEILDENNRPFELSKFHY